MLVKLILAVAFTLPSLSFASPIVHAFDCKITSRSNMKRLTMTLVEEKIGSSSNLKASIFFTKADRIIKNRVLTASTRVTRSKSAVQLHMDKDPYDGRVGNFKWSFSFPIGFLRGEVPEDFGTDESQIMSYKWEGTPQGQGDNTGFGYLDHWSCRSLNQ